MWVQGVGSRRRSAPGHLVAAEPMPFLDPLISWFPKSAFRWSRMYRASSMRWWATAIPP